MDRQSPRASTRSTTTTTMSDPSSQDIPEKTHRSTAPNRMPTLEALAARSLNFHCYTDIYTNLAAASLALALRVHAELILVHPRALHLHPLALVSPLPSCLVDPTTTRPTQALPLIPIMQTLLLRPSRTNHKKKRSPAGIRMSPLSRRSRSECGQRRLVKRT